MMQLEEQSSQCSDTKDTNQYDFKNFNPIKANLPLPPVEYNSSEQELKLILKINESVRSESRVILQDVENILTTYPQLLRGTKANINKIVQEVSDPLMDSIKFGLTMVDFPLLKINEGSDKKVIDLNNYIDRIRIKYDALKLQQRDSITNKQEKFLEKVKQLEKLKAQRQELINQLEDLIYRIQDLISAKKSSIAFKSQVDLLDQIVKIIQYIKSTIQLGQDLLDKLITGIQKANTINDSLERETQYLTDIFIGNHQNYLDVIKSQRSKIINISDTIQKILNRPGSDPDNKNNQQINNNNNHYELIINNIVMDIENFRDLSEINYRGLDLDKIKSDIACQEARLFSVKERFEKYKEKLSLINTINLQVAPYVESSIKVFQVFLNIQEKSYNWIKELLTQAQIQQESQNLSKTQLAPEKRFQKMQQSIVDCQELFQQVDQPVKKNQAFIIRKNDEEEKMMKTKQMIQTKLMFQQTSNEQKNNILSKLEKQFVYFKKQGRNLLVLIQRTESALKQLAQFMLHEMIDEIQEKICLLNTQLHSEFDDLKDIDFQADRITYQSFDDIINKIKEELSENDLDKIGFEKKEKKLNLFSTLMKTISNEERDNQITNNHQQQNELLLLTQLIKEL